jgi:hypothetical protein
VGGQPGDDPPQRTENGAVARGERAPDNTIPFRYVFRSCDAIGKRSIEEAIKAARGQPVEKRIDVGTALVTRENANSFLR